MLLKFIGSFRVLIHVSNACTIDQLRRMCTHPTFDAVRLGPYYHNAIFLVMKSLVLKHLQQMLVLLVLTLNQSLKIGYLTTTPIYILTSYV